MTNATSKKVAIFWPGDYRTIPNEQALPGVEETTAQLERALAKIGCSPYRVPGFISKPIESIEKLSQIDDPMIGVCTHWIYGPNTTDGTVCKDNPLLLASNFSGKHPGLVGLLNTSSCLEVVDRKHSRLWTDQADWSADEVFMDRLSEWCRNGELDWPRDEISYELQVSDAAAKIANAVHEQIERRRIMIMMLGDTSMGMINGYFGHRLLNPVGFTEHKVDQAWLLERGPAIESSRIDAALHFVKEKGVRFHYGESGAEDFDENATREQLRDYLTVLGLIEEFGADCMGWQYQLGLIGLRPPSDFSEGLLNSVCRPESNGDTIVCATEADQGNVLPMELMKRLLKQKGLHQAVFFHDVRWGAEHEGRFLWLLLNSGSTGAYAFNHDPDTLQGVHSYRQPKGYFPVPGGTFAGESLPGKVTWSRAYLEDGKLHMDIGKGSVVKLPPEVRDAWWNGTTRQWPFMATDMGISRETLMAHYMSNHVAVAYGDIFEEMQALSKLLGFEVRILGEAR